MTKQATQAEKVDEILKISKSVERKMQKYKGQAELYTEQLKPVVDGIVDELTTIKAAIEELRGAVRELNGAGAS